MGDFAVILTHNRPDELARCVAAVGPQVDAVVIVDNASDPAVPVTGWPENVACLYIPDQPPNLSNLWNRALKRIQSTYPTGPEWNVALLCDDTVPDPSWFEIVRDWMRGLGVAAASTGQSQPVPSPIVKTEPDSDIWNRMCGWAFMVAGEKHIYADERLKWWWADTEMDWRARANGGMAIVPGPVVVNERPNDFTYSVPGLNDQAGADGVMFEQIHGWRPW